MRDGNSEIYPMNADGTPDDTDTSTIVRNLYYDILTNQRWYQSQDLTMQQMGVTANLANIILPSPDLKVSEFGASMEYAEDAFRRLDGLSYGGVHEIDPFGVFKVYVPKSAPSGIIIADNYTDSVLTNWPSAKIALMVDRTEFKHTGEEYRKSIRGIGGSRAGRDTALYKTASGASETLNGKAWAIKIPTITFIQPQYIGAKIDKLGTPTANLSIELREDKDGQPTGHSVRTVDFDKNGLPASGSPDFRFMDMAGEQLNSKQSYWLILYQNGDVSNTIRWYRDSSTTSGVTRAFSTNNGASWTVENNSYQFTLDYWFINELVDIKTNDYNVISGNWYYAEEIIREPNLKDDLALSQLLDGTADRMFYDKEVWKGLIYAPDAPLDNGSRVRIRQQNNPIKQFDYDDFIISGIEYVFDADSDEPDGMMYYDVTAVRLVR